MAPSLDYFLVLYKINPKICYSPQAPSESVGKITESYLIYEGVALHLAEYLYRENFIELCGWPFLRCPVLGEIFSQLEGL